MWARVVPPNRVSLLASGGSARPPTPEHQTQGLPREDRAWLRDSVIMSTDERPTSRDQVLCPTPHSRRGQARRWPIGLAGEQPLRPDLSIATEHLQVLEISALREEVQAACCCLVANALWTAWQGNAWIFYSRDNSHFAAARNGVPSWYARSALVAAVDLLVSAGFLEERRTSPSPSAKHRSRFRATAKLMGAAAAAATCLLREKAPSVMLRCREDRRILNPAVVLPPDEMAKMTLIARDVEEHNEFLSAFSIRLALPGTEILPGGIVRCGGVFIDTHRKDYRRIFNGDLEHGGRWYGVWWQGVPSALRRHLTIDCKPTVELDFAACQLRLMFGLLALPDPLNGAIRNAAGSDLYAIEGVARDDVKSAVLIMINAGSMRAARDALAAKLTHTPISSRRRKATDILQVVERHFPEVGNSVL